jgi:hypothetical protein
MKPQTKPFQTEAEENAPILEPQVKAELNKLLAARIIFLVRHTQWISNIVPVRKKNGDIRLCVDFINVNKASEKDNYPVPPMEKILQCVFGSHMLSLLDGFSSYNKVLVAHDDQLKTAFSNQMGDLCLQENAFWINQCRETFQRAMDIDFRGLIGECVVVYLDDVTVFSKNMVDHITHPRKVFNRCRRYGISLNPKKYVFVVDEGRMLGFIVSKEGMMIEPERTQAISKIPPPHNKKSMQSFLGKINFVRRFVPSFVETVKPLQDMIKKDAEFKWGPKEKVTFEKYQNINNSGSDIDESRLQQYFILYMFSSDVAFAVVLTQKYQDGNEYPITFMSSGLQGVELDYPEVDKQAYVVFKVVKHFRPYLIKSKTKVIVPYPAVRNLLVQKDLGEKRANWIMALQEYDLEIKPTNIVKGQGLLLDN